MYATPKEIALRLSVSRDAVYYWARCGKLPGAVRIGGTLRIELKAFDEFLRTGGDLRARDADKQTVHRPCCTGIESAVSG